jgi:drug/metabolite transporter (DMT)-like permease
MSQPQPPPFNPFLALAFGVVAISFGAIFARLADAPALVIAAYRVGLAVLVIAPVAWFQTRAEIAALSGRELGLALGAGFFLALHFATWISSLDYTSVANSVVLVNTNPLWVGLLTPFITQDRLSPQTKISIGLSVIGGIIIGAGDFALGADALLGDFLALAGSICAAFYILIGRRLRPKVSLLAYIFLCYGAAAAILWTLVIGAGLPVAGYSGQTVAAFWAMALIPQLIGHSAYNWSLRWFSSGLIAVSLLGEPIGATLLAYFLFHETLNLSKTVGGGLILVAIYLAAKAER